VTGAVEQNPPRWQAQALEVWDVSAGRRQTSIPLPEFGPPTPPTFSGDSRFLAWLAPAEVRVFAAETGELTGRVPAPGVGAACLSPDGTALAWSSAYSMSTGTKVEVGSGPGSEPVR